MIQLERTWNNNLSVFYFVKLALAFFKVRPDPGLLYLVENGYISHVNAGNCMNFTSYKLM